MSTQPTLVQLMKLKQMQAGQVPDTGAQPQLDPMASASVGSGAPQQESAVPGVSMPPTSRFDQSAPQPRLMNRVLGGMQGQPGGGAGGLVGRIAMGAAQGALGPTQVPDIERERLQKQQLQGQSVIEKMRLAEEDKRLQEMLTMGGARLGSQEQIAAGHDATRENVAGQQIAGREALGTQQIAGRAGLETSREGAAQQRLGEQIAERRYEANLKANTEQMMGQMRIEASKQLKLMPPEQIRAMAYTAQSTMNEIPKGIAMVDQLDQSGELGPIAGRWNDLITGKVGVGDPRYMQLREFLTLNVAAALRTHFGARGGQLMFDKFLENLNIAGQSPANIKAAMAEVSDWFGGYVDMATQPGYLTGTPQALGPEGPPAPGALKGGPRQGGGQQRPSLDSIFK